MTTPKLAYPPLLFADNDWISRWMVTVSGDRLHRVSEIKWHGKERLSGRGVTVCGQPYFLLVPGLLTRLKAPRCRTCCRLLGIRQGLGAPYNGRGKDMLV